MTGRTLRAMKEMGDKTASDVKRQAKESANAARQAAPGIAAD